MIKSPNCPTCRGTGQIRKLDGSGEMRSCIYCPQIRTGARPVFYTCPNGDNAHPRRHVLAGRKCPHCAWVAPAGAASEGAHDAETRRRIAGALKSN